MATNSGNTVTSYDLIGKDISVDDVISRIQPDRTKFLSTIGKDEAIDQTLHQWEEDELRAPGENAAVEGADATPTPRQMIAMRSNVTQIFQDTFKISETSNRVKTFGRAAEAQYQTAKMGVQLRQDREYAMVARSKAAVQGTSTTPGYMGSIHTMIIPEQIQDLSTGTGSSKVLGTFTEDELISGTEALWNQGVDATILMGPGPLARAVANFAFKAPVGQGQRTNMVEDPTTLIAHVDIYEGPFGPPVRVVKNRVFDPQALMLFDPSLWKGLALRGWKTTPLAKTGDASTYQMVGEFSLKNKNFRSAFLWTGVGPAATA